MQRYLFLIKIVSICKKKHEKVAAPILLTQPLRPPLTPKNSSEICARNVYIY